MMSAATQDEQGSRDAVQRMIAERAYFNAEREGFAPGRELDHWLAAEAETMTTMATSVNGGKSPRRAAAATKAVTGAAIKKAAAKPKATTDSATPAKPRAGKKATDA